jgi:hypothetical protein
MYVTSLKLYAPFITYHRQVSELSDKQPKPATDEYSLSAPEQSNCPSSLYNLAVASAAGRENRIKQDDPVFSTILLSWDYVGLSITWWQKHQGVLHNF